MKRVYYSQLCCYFLTTSKNMKLASSGPPSQALPFAKEANVQIKITNVLLGFGIMNPTKFVKIISWS